jgi:hypothetical protein
MSRKFPSNSQAGQAILEYTLILCVIILLILGATYKFNQAFRVFASGIMNSYTTCLLQTGELPGNSPICSERFKKFNSDSGKELVKATDGDGSGSGGAGADGDDSDPSARRRGRNARGSMDRSDSGSTNRAEGQGGNVGGMKSASDYFNKKGRQKTSIVGTTKDEKNFTGSTGTSKRPRLVGNLAKPGTEQRSTLDRKFVMDKEETERGGPPKPIAAPDQGESLTSSAKVSYAVKRETASKTIDDEGFSFGDWLRILLIMAIVIALGMLLLGQGVQISKSWEK